MMNVEFPRGRRLLVARVLAVAIVATFAPLVLLIANRDWFFTPEGFLDPWQYVGFFRFYEDLDYSPEEYKLARLPWILAGYSITRSIPTMPSAYLLHAIFLCATPLTLFGALQTLLRQPVLAGVLALWLGFYTHAHGSGGWDYHNTATGAFYLATLWLAVLPSSLRGRPVTLMLAGVMGALTVHTNLTMVNLLPALLFLHIQASRANASQSPSRRMFVRGGWALIGALLATALLGTVNWAVGRDFLFFQKLVAVVLRYLSERDLQAGRPLWDLGWVLTSKHLALPAAIFIAGAVSLVIQKRVRPEEAQRVQSALIVQFLAVTLLWLAWQVLGHTALDWDYMSYGLIPSAFLALGGLLSRGWPDSLDRRWVLTTVSTGVLLAICLIGTVPGLGKVEAFVAPTILLVGCAVFLVPIGTYLWRPSVITACLLLAVFAFCNRLVTGLPSNYAASDPCKVQPAVYGAIVEAASQLVRIDPVYRRIRIWFDEDEMISPLPGCSVSLGSMGYSIRTMASMDYVTTPFPMPGVDDLPEQAIRPLQNSDAILVIISGRPETLEKWGHRLAALGLTHRVLDRVRVPVMESGFTIHAWAVTSTP